MSELDAFRAEVRDWLEANCPAEMREPIRDEEDRANVEAAMNFFRDVTYTEDYVIGLEIQRGLESGAHDELVFGKNERGNQYFHEWLNWYLEDDISAPEPVM